MVELTNWKKSLDKVHLAESTKTYFLTQSRKLYFQSKTPNLWSTWKLKSKFSPKSAILIFYQRLKSFKNHPLFTLWWTSAKLTYKSISKTTKLMNLKPKISSNKSWQDSRNLMKKVLSTETLNLGIFWLLKTKQSKYQISG